MAKSKSKMRPGALTADQIADLWNGSPSEVAKRMGKTVSSINYHRNKNKKGSPKDTNSPVGRTSMAGTKPFSMSMNGNNYSFANAPKVIRIGDLEIEF